jgi:hypothetical protein
LRDVWVVQIFPSGGTKMSAPDPADRKLDIFKIFRSRLEFEYNLISQRITWPMLSAGALTAAIIAASGLGRAGAQVDYAPIVIGLLILFVMFICVLLSEPDSEGSSEASSGDFAGEDFAAGDEGHCL